MAGSKRVPPNNPVKRKTKPNVGLMPIQPLAGGPPANMAAMAPKRRPRPAPRAPMSGMPAMGGGGMGGPSPAPGGGGGGVPLAANGV